jgi:hypothetical protein
MERTPVAEGPSALRGSSLNASDRRGQGVPDPDEAHQLAEAGVFADRIPLFRASSAAISAG